MEGIITFSIEDRKIVSETLKRSACNNPNRRAIILNFLFLKFSYRVIRQVLECSYATIREVKNAFLQYGVQHALGLEKKSKRVPAWWQKLLHLTLNKQPRDFGFYRTRWSCATLAKVLFEKCRISRCQESVRLILKDLGFTWSRPKPTIRLTDPDYERKIASIRRKLRRIQPGAVWVYQDEVQIDSNPKIGSQWMLRGYQDPVETPGNNQRAHIAVSIVHGTNKVIASAPVKSRNQHQFIAHLEDLSEIFSDSKVINVICDNANFHKSDLVQAYLKGKKGRIKLHFLPKYSPDDNPVEKLFWRLHEAITRNHKCTSLEELLEQVYTWFEYPDTADTINVEEPIIN